MCNQKKQGLSPDSIQTVAASCPWVSHLSIPLFFEAEIAVCGFLTAPGVGTPNPCIVQWSYIHRCRFFGICPLSASVVQSLTLIFEKVSIIASNAVFICFSCYFYYAYAIPFVIVLHCTLIFCSFSFFFLFACQFWEFPLTFLQAH